MVLSNSNEMLFAQTNHFEMEVVYFRKGLTIKPTHIYLAKVDSAFLLNFQNGHIVFPDTITTKYVDLILVYKNENIAIPMFEYKEAKYLHIYFDNRLFNNPVTKKFPEYSKRKYLFKRRYLIDCGLHYFLIAKKIKKHFVFSPPGADMQLSLVH